MKKVVYPGSFDPITIGHLDIITRASKIFDEVVVLIMKNVEKKGLFTYHERKQLIKEAIHDLDNVKVAVSTGLLIDYMKDHDITTIVKGLRNSTDFQYEMDMALINKTIDPQIDTVFLLSNPKYIMISSSNVRELISYRADINGFVPEVIVPKINKMMESHSL